VLKQNAVLTSIPASYSGLSYCIGGAAPRLLLLLQQVPSPLRINVRAVITCVGSARRTEEIQVSAVIVYMQ